jgi:hypothetical protein
MEHPENRHIIPRFPGVIGDSRVTSGSRFSSDFPRGRFRLFGTGMTTPYFVPSNSLPPAVSVFCRSQVPNRQISSVKLQVSVCAGYNVLDRPVSIPTTLAQPTLPPRAVRHTV